LISNLCAEDPFFRNYYLGQNIVQIVKELLEINPETERLKTAVWFMGNLLDGKVEPMHYQNLVEMCPMIFEYLEHPEIEIRSDAAHCLGFMVRLDH